MTKRSALFAVAVFAALASVSGATNATKRSAAAVAEFKRQHPCPATGRARGACPGYVVDHVRPLCAGGPDEPANMQWQTRDAAKVKDRTERAQCRRR